MRSTPLPGFGPIEGIWQSSFHALCFLALRQQLAPHFLPQGPQRIELLVVKILLAGAHPVR